MSESLDRRLHENRARMLRPEIAAELGRALNEPVSPNAFVSHDRTTTLRQIFAEHAKAAESNATDRLTLDEDEALSIAADAGARLQGRSAYLLHHADEDVGAVLVPVDQALMRAREVWGVARNGVTLVTGDGLSGISLESDCYGDGVEAFRILAWGEFEQMTGRLS